MPDLSPASSTNSVASVATAVHQNHCRRQNQRKSSHSFRFFSAVPVLLLLLLLTTISINTSMSFGGLFLPSARVVQAWTTTTSRRGNSARRIIISTHPSPFPTAFHPLLQRPQRTLTRCFASGDGNNNNKNNNKPKNKWQRKNPTSKKFKVNPDISKEQAAANLAAVFDELATKEGFGSASSAQQILFAKDSTFEDKFTEEDLDEFLDDDFEDDDDDDDFDENDDSKSVDTSNYWGDESVEAAADNSSGLNDDGGPVVGQAQSTEYSMEARIAASRKIGSFKLGNAEDFDFNEEDDDDDDYLDFGSDGMEDDMDARLAAAQQDLDRGRVSADPRMNDITKDDMRRLGFKQELNPFEGDSTPRQDDFRLITNAMTCTACGADFQARNESRPGYLPPEKYDIQVKLSHIEELQNLKTKAESEEWTPEDEVEWLLQTSGDGAAASSDAVNDIDLDAVAEDLGIDLGAEMGKTKNIICKRCHGLQNYGKVEDALRPGWTDEPLMSQAKFRDLLRPLSEKPAVLIAIVDLFDFSGSVLSELDAIAGENPVILAANKADLLPSQMGQQRAENWVRRELEYMGVESLANMGGAVRLISCKTGTGINALLNKARKLAEEMDCDIYVVGAANAGKSTLMNHILRNKEENSLRKDKNPQKRRRGNENSRKGALTTSPLPGTTLKFIKVDLGQGRNIYDTPGLLVPGTLTQLLTPEELKIVVPNRRVEPITFRLAAGKCVQVGGLARISVVGDCKPFLFTFFVANQVKLHPTDVSKADDFVANHAGEMLTPPLAPGPERMEQIGEFETHVVEIKGRGWKEAAADITLTGLGWVAVTGAGTALVEISIPKGIGVQVRPPLMPFDMWEVTARYTGSKAVRKSGKSVSGKRRKGVGRN